MVEAENPYEEQDKSFVDEPAILDKFKAAAAVTDGEYSSSILF